MDKRYFHKYLNDLKDSNPELFGLIESIQNNFEETYEAISDTDRKALRNYPLQFIKRIKQDDEWTTQLHIWAEQCVPEILELDPLILAHKNGFGDSVLMSLVSGATGTHTEVVDHKFIARILSTNMDYEYTEIENGTETTLKANALDVKDANGDTVLDYLMDFAYATGKYQGQLPDEMLQAVLKHFAGYLDEVTDNEPEVIQVEEVENEEDSENPQSDEDNSSLTIDSTLD